MDYDINNKTVCHKGKMVRIREKVAELQPFKEKLLRICIELKKYSKDTPARTRLSKSNDISGCKFERSRTIVKMVRRC